MTNLQDRYLSCISMIESVIAYENETIDKTAKDNRYMQAYITELGEDVVDKLIAKVRDNIVGINYDVHTCSDGLSYNSLIKKSSDYDLTDLPKGDEND